MPKALMFILAIWVSLLTTAMATVPHQISIQGRLLDGGGVIVRDTTHAVTFKIYVQES